MRLTEWADLTPRQWQQIELGGYWFLRPDVIEVLGFALTRSPMGIYQREPEHQRQLNALFVERKEAEAEKQREIEEAKNVTELARAAVAAIDDPLARAVLDLHAEDEQRECYGCDMGAYAESGADYPCSTVTLIAKRFDVDLPDRWV